MGHCGHDPADGARDSDACLPPRRSILVLLGCYSTGGGSKIAPPSQRASVLLTFSCVDSAVAVVLLLLLPIAYGLSMLDYIACTAASQNRRKRDMPAQSPGLLVSSEASFTRRESESEVEAQRR